jgi:hypothetical protein
MSLPKSIGPVLLLLLSLPTVGGRRQERRYHYPTTGHGREETGEEMDRH